MLAYGFRGWSGPSALLFSPPILLVGEKQWFGVPGGSCLSRGMLAMLLPSSLGRQRNHSAVHTSLQEFPHLEFQGIIPGAADTTWQIENAGPLFAGREGDGKLQHPAPTTACPEMKLI